MEARLNRLDDRLRAGLLGEASPLARGLCAALTLAAFFLLLLTRTFLQTVGSKVFTALLFLVPLAVMLYVGEQLTKDKLINVLGICVLCGAAMLARLSFIERSAGDYDIYLADWLQKLASGSFSDGMRANIGEYNVVYQYILFLITRLPVAPLYAVKAVSFIGDALLAGAAARLCGKKPAAFAAALLLPTIVLNGGMFAQCDSLYAACALWGLAWSLEEKPGRAAVCFALSLAFKLQAVFLLPIVAVLWADKKLRLEDALIFVGTLILTALPAILGGKSIGSILSIYTAQTGLYTDLNYGAPNFFALMNTQGLDVYAYGNFAMGLAFGVCALLVVMGIRRAGQMTRGDYLRLALLLPLLIVFFLPRMHERYFYLADILGVALACYDRRMVPAAALIALASLASYWEMALPLSLCAGMMLLAAVLVIAGHQKEQ